MNEELEPEPEEEIETGPEGNEPEELEVERSTTDESANDIKALREQIAQQQNMLNALVQKELAAREKPKVVPEPEPPSYDFKSAQKAYAELLISGETEKAAEKMGEILAAQQEQFDFRLKKQAREFEAKTKETQTYATAEARREAELAKLEAKYPALVPGGEGFNKETNGLINALASGFVSRGMDEIDALRKAIESFKHLMEPNNEEDETVVDMRRAQARNTAQAAARRQPRDLRAARKAETGALGEGLENLSGLDRRRHFKMMPLDKRSALLSGKG